MCRMTFFDRLFSYWIVTCTVIALVGMSNAAWAQNALGYMVLQDFSDCTNGDVSPNSPTIGGEVKVARNADGTTSVGVVINATENTTYHFFLKCVRILGDITTGPEGVGSGFFTFRTNETGNTFAFDMYPEGAPLGNKYQSTQITPF